MIFWLKTLKKKLLLVFLRDFGWIGLVCIGLYCHTLWSWSNPVNKQVDFATKKTQNVTTKSFQLYNDLIQEPLNSVRREDIDKKNDSPMYIHPLYIETRDNLISRAKGYIYTATINYLIQKKWIWKIWRNQPEQKGTGFQSIWIMYGIVYSSDKRTQRLWSITYMIDN